jgi:hypothetical protein
LSQLHEKGRAALPELEVLLTQDAPIDVLESYEANLKEILLEAFARPMPGEAARQIARFQQSIGFLLKYKSYAVKAASPLGYSVFLQRPGEGFSFQRHITRKTEIFHILEVLPGGFVFLCDYEQWCEVYEPEAFSAWLAGRPDPRYDQFRTIPKPGDVFHVDKLNVVHTVIGCVLEEYATVSVDMVDRLHDQNMGKAIPVEFRRPLVMDRLRKLRPPRGEETVQLSNGTINATRYTSSTPAMNTAGDAASLFVLSGTGVCVVCDDDELHRAEPPALRVQAGDLLLLPPHTNYRLVGDSLNASEHRLRPELALA